MVIVEVSRVDVISGSHRHMLVYPLDPRRSFGRHLIIEVCLDPAAKRSVAYLKAREDCRDIAFASVRNERRERTLSHLDIDVRTYQRAIPSKKMVPLIE